MDRLRTRETASTGYFPDKTPGGEEIKIMKITMSAHGNKARNKRGKQKPKVRWEQLGLSDPSETSAAPSIEEIRREVTLMASRGLAQGTRTRSVAKVAHVDPARTGLGRQRRRGATE